MHYDIATDFNIATDCIIFGILAWGMTLLSFAIKLEEKEAKLTKKQGIAILVTVLVSLLGIGLAIRKNIKRNSKIVGKIETTSDEELTTCEVTSTNGKIDFFQNIDDKGKKLTEKEKKEANAK